MNLARQMRRSRYLRRKYRKGQIRVTILVATSIHASSWVVICAAKLLSLQSPTRLITQRSVVQIHPPQPTNQLNCKAFAAFERFFSFGFARICTQNLVELRRHSLFVFANGVRVSQRGFWIYVSQPILP